MKATDRSNDPAVQSWDYTPKQWAEIKKILARVGVNADTVTLTTLDSLRDALNKLREEGLDKLREKSLESEARHAAFEAALPGLRDETLRETLVYTARAAIALHGTTPTAKQHAAAVRDAIAKIEAAQQALFALAEYGYRPHKAVRSELAFTIAYLRRELDVLALMPDASRDHGVTAAAVFTAHVVIIWEQLTDRLPKRPQRKLLIDFLLACSDPAFPTTRSAVERWLRRHQPKRRT